MILPLRHGKNRPNAQRLNWSALWQVDGARARQHQTTLASLVVPLRLRKREAGIRLYSGERRVDELRHLRRPHGPNLWEMDCTAAECSLITRASLALPLRVRNRTQCCRRQSEKRQIGLLRLHHRPSNQEAIYQARHGGYQTAHDLAADAPALWQSPAQGVSLIWRERHQGLRALAGLRSILGGYGSELSRRYEYRAHRQRRTLRTRQLRLGASIRAIKEQKAFIEMEAK